MNTTTALERKPRCRMHNRLDDRCSNEVVDDDPNAVQICPVHALRAAQLLAEKGAITIAYASTTRRTT